MSSGPIAVVFGGPTAEHDISILTGLQCEHLLRKCDRAVHAIYWDRAGQWHLVPPRTEARDYVNGAPTGSATVELRLCAAPGWYRRRRLRDELLETGVVLNCFHGGFGEGGGAQFLFETLGIRSTGGSPYAAAIGMDKLAFGALMRDAGIATLPRVALSEDSKPDFAGPYIVKPRFGGSSVGIEVVGDVATALEILKTSVHLRQGAVVEPFRPDLFDLNIAYRTYPAFETSLIERPQRIEGSRIYSYEDKYLHGAGLASAPREIPANVPTSLAETVRGLAARVREVTGLTGIVRVDMLTNGDAEVYVNEVNSIPGAMALYLWPAEDEPTQLLLDMVDEASLAGATISTQFKQGVALQSAAGIASKLLGLESIRGHSRRSDAS